MVKKRKKVTRKVKQVEVKTRSVTRKLKKSKTLFRTIFPWFAAIFLAILFMYTFLHFYRQTTEVIDQVIVENVENLSKIFKQIDETCGIISFEHEKNYVDFLTVAKFVGSEVGAMNLRFPKGWGGPYVGDNPTVQEKQYVIFSTDKGYYLSPDDGVKLSDGRVIGEDIVLSGNTDFEALIKDGTLTPGGKALAARIK